MGRRVQWAQRGQATVELAVVLPVALIIAVVAVNALTFFGTCASFDRVARQTICAYAAAPSSGQDAGAVAQCVEDELLRSTGASADDVHVSVEASSLGLMRFTARVEYAPTLFGMEMRGAVFGVSLPRLVHEVTMVVDTYRPGILF